MNERMNIRNHINKFNKCIIRLLSVHIKIGEKDPTIISHKSLLKSYNRMMITFLVGKMMLTKL